MACAFGVGSNQRKPEPPDERKAKLEEMRTRHGRLKDRMVQFIDGERDFEDAITTEEYVVEVEVSEVER